MIVMISLVVGILLAYANGANDNFKGVATLYGSETTTYRRALVWATATTALGSITAVWLARELLLRFSGKGIVPDTLVTQNEFGVAVDLFGRDKKYVMQRGDDLGEKMLNSIQDAFAEGVTRVLVIGSDCPDIEIERKDPQRPSIIEPRKIMLISVRLQQDARDQES